VCCVLYHIQLLYRIVISQGGLVVSTSAVDCLERQHANMTLLLIESPPLPDNSNIVVYEAQMTVLEVDVKMLKDVGASQLLSLLKY